MRRRDFQRVVLQALEQLPKPFLHALDNLDIQIRWQPTPEELRRAGIPPGQTLFGLYLGVPLPQRGHHYTLTLPDTILIYQLPHERYCRTEAEMVEQVRLTLLHEIGHYLGLDEDRLQELGVG